MSDNATLVVTAVPNPDEMASVQTYLEGVMPLLIGAGGSLVKRMKVGQVIHGRPNGMVLVMDFSSAQAVTDLFDSEEYAALVPIRDQGFAEMNIQIAQAM